MLPTLEHLEPRHLCASTPLAAFDPAPAGAFVQAYVKPDASNTGYTGDLAKWTGSNTFSTPNVEIDNVSFRGTLLIKAQNVTLRNFKLNAAWNSYGVQVLPGGSVHLISGEIVHADSAAVTGNDWSADRMFAHELGSDAFNGGGDNQLTNSYVTKIGMDAGSHADGAQFNNGTGIVIRNDNFNLPWYSESKSGQVYRANACVFLNGYTYGAKYLNGTVIDHCWLSGGNFAVYSLQQTNTSITNCVFDEDAEQYGDLTGSVSLFTGNVTATGALL